MHKFASIAFITLASVVSVASAQNYTQVNLVANTTGVAPVTDPNLINPWGLSRSSGSAWWVSDAGTGVSTLYNGAGSVIPLVVTILPNPNGSAKTGSPSGTIFNGNSADFILKSGGAAKFLFATLDGTIQGWNGGNAQVAFAAKDGSVYTGLTSANIGANTFLYAANAAKGRIDVFSAKFKPVALPSVPDGNSFNPDKIPAFYDGDLASTYAPFNVQAIGTNLVVTYAPKDGTPGPGLGYVDIFSPAGQLLLRLQHNAWLNSPWGVALAPNDFGAFSHALLVGQNGGNGTANSGTISAYDLVTGRYLGTLLDSTNKPLAIDGLWAISFGNPVPNSTGTASGSYDPDSVPSPELYFTAGPNDSAGLLGYIQPVSSELTDGNDQ